jgi:hypothetical protein
VNISQRTVTVFMDQDGREVMGLAAIDMSESAGLPVYVQDTDDIGIWARIDRADGDHLVLIRWDYVLSVDFSAGQDKTVGLRP